MRRQIIALLATALAFAGGLAFAQDQPIRVASKQFTEQLVLGKIIVLALEDAGLSVSDQVNLGSSDVNRNPKDTHDHPSGVWTLPPTLTLGAQVVPVGEVTVTPEFTSGRAFPQLVERQALPDASIGGIIDSIEAGKCNCSSRRRSLAPKKRWHQNCRKTATSYSWSFRYVCGN